MLLPFLSTSNAVLADKDNFRRVWEWGTNTNIKVEAKAKTSVKSTGAVVKLKYHLVQLYQ